MKSIKPNKINFSMSCFKWIIFSDLRAEQKQNFKL
jgi:hypothetical protein